MQKLSWPTAKMKQKWENREARWLRTNDLFRVAANARTFLRIGIYHWAGQRVYTYIEHGVPRLHTYEIVKSIGKNTFTDVPLDYYRMHAIGSFVFLFCFHFELAWRHHRIALRAKSTITFTVVAPMVRTFLFRPTRNDSTQQIQSKSNECK